ncbi:MAG: peptidylprolyl isomerase [Thermoanaerobaculia bacterium]|nr:peptidylprolyl isomerase [Thermoanaerobaculia bacterium]
MRCTTFRAPQAPCVAALCATTLFALAATPPAGGQALEPEAEAAGSRVIARVNGEALYAEDLEIALGEIHRSQSVQRRSDYDLDQLMFRLVNDTLLAQEARTLAMDDSPELRRKLEARRESRARTRVFREEIGEKLDFNEEAVRAVYDDVYRVAKLRVLTRRDRGELEALRPKMIAAQDETAFAALAEVESQDPYALRGGKIHAAFTDLYKSILDYIGVAKPGEVSQPLATQWGWTLAVVDGVEPADPSQLEARRNRTLVELRYRQERALRLALAERLKPTLGLAVDWSAYEAVELQRMHDGKLLPKFAEPERLIVRLAGRTITVEQFAGRLVAAWSTVSNATLALEYKPGVLDDLIFEEMLVAEGLRRGYGDTPEVKRELHALEVSQLSSRYLKETVAAGVEITPQEAREYYEAHKGEFRKPPRLHLLQLTVPKLEEAERIAELARGGADFAWLVRQHSTDRYKEAGGVRGWVAANQGITNFRSELAHAQKGDVLGPREAPNGWIVVKVDLYEEQDHYPFEAVSGNVKARLQSEEIVARIDSVVQKLRERSEIWIDREAVAALSILPTAPVEAAPMPGHDGR